MSFAWGRLGAAAFGPGLLGLQLMSAVPGYAQVAPPAANPSTTRSDEPAPTANLADPAASPGTDVPVPTQTAAAPGATDGRLTYEAAFFATFSPANALEVVQRIPGFQFDEGDTEVRGFGQAAGNVVINGQRPSSKSDTLETVLRRIPANRVARVEVGRGDLFGAEFAGRPQVANLVLTAGGGLAGTVSATLARDFTGRLFPGGTASVLARRGRSSFNASIGTVSQRSSEEGFDRLTELPSGRQIEFRDKLNEIEEPQGYVTAGWEFDGGPNDTAHLNGRVSTELTRLTQTNLVFPADGPDRNDRLTQRYRTRGFEIGGDYTKPFAGGGIKLIGLATRRFRLDRDAELRRIGDELRNGFAQTVDAQRDETVVRVVWNRQGLRGWSVELGVEGALNRLDSRVDLFSLGAGGVPTRIDLPVDDAVVEEYRGEAFVNAGRALSKRLRLDVGATLEASELTVSGDASAARTLKFFKPRATLDWRAPTGWHAQASVKRTVAQLQFEDFISAAELTNERINGGNAQLLPQRAWELFAFLEKPVLGDGLVRVEAGYNFISLVQDRVPTPEGFDAPGNLGNGRLFLARARVDAPLAKLGIKGGRFTVYGSYVKTAVLDPYTGVDRAFSNNSAFFFEAQLRQDLKKVAWGLSLNGATESVAFRQNEEDAFSQSLPFVSAFAEYRPNPRTQVTLTLDNLRNAPAFRERLFFFPDRRTREPGLLEFRRRNAHVVPILSLKHSFG